MALYDMNNDLNSFQPSVAFDIETSQMTGFYIKCNTGMKWAE